MADDLELAARAVYEIVRTHLSWDGEDGYGLTEEQIASVRRLGKWLDAEPFHYECPRKDAWTITETNAPAYLRAGFAIGTVIPAVPCTCGAETDG